MTFYSTVFLPLTRLSYGVAVRRDVTAERQVTMVSEQAIFLSGSHIYPPKTHLFTDKTQNTVLETYIYECLRVVSTGCVCHCVR